VLKPASFNWCCVDLTEWFTLLRRQLWPALSQLARAVLECVQESEAAEALSLASLLPHPHPLA
jgi:hypothetical protein